MNRKIKVYLQYPWKFPDSPYYKYLIDNPPEGVEYLNTEKQKGVITNKRFFWFSNFLKRNIRRSLNLFKLSIPNFHLSPDGDYDIIHCAHCLSKNKDKPWVADVESLWQLYIGNENKWGIKKVKKILEDENCKKILPWTQATADEIIKQFPEIKNKVEVVYPAIPARIIKKKINSKKITLIFSGRYFYWKGGLHALEVLERLTKKYPQVYGIINSEVPEEIKKKYSTNNKIKFYGLIPQQKLFDLYKKADILVYPGFSDSFGFGFLEAMSFGLPIVTINTKGTKARKEIVTNNKTGLIFDVQNEISLDKIGSNEEEIIRKLIENCSKLIENKRLRERMSKSCLEEIKNGRFSIKERNKKLKRIYE